MNGFSTLMLERASSQASAGEARVALVLSDAGAGIPLALTNSTDAALHVSGPLSRSQRKPGDSAASDKAPQEEGHSVAASFDAPFGARCDVSEGHNFDGSASNKTYSCEGDDMTRMDVGDRSPTAAAANKENPEQVDADLPCPADLDADACGAGGVNDQEVAQVSADPYIVDITIGMFSQETAAGTPAHQVALNGPASSDAVRSLEVISTPQRSTTPRVVHPSPRNSLPPPESNALVLARSATLEKHVVSLSKQIAGKDSMIASLTAQADTQRHLLDERDNLIANLADKLRFAQREVDTAQRIAEEATRRADELEYEATVFRARDAELVQSVELVSGRCLNDVE